MAKTENNFIKVAKNDGSTGFILFLAWVGALVYFVQTSVGFGGFIVAVLKSFVWPAILIHHVFTLLQL